MEKFTYEVYRKVEQGQNILLCTSIFEHEVEGFFTSSDLCCDPIIREACAMTGNPVALRTLGLSIDTEHPALKEFPTLGLVYEKKIGKGKLLVCASDLKNNLHIPEVRQLYKSLCSYLNI